MSRPGIRALAGLVALAATFAIVGLSRLPYDFTAEDHAMIRLSWRTPGERVEECRRLTEEELERLPLHMRREEVCEGRMLPYRLHVTLDGRVVVDEIVRPTGAREDRPLYVHRELLVPPGEHQVGIVWEREGADSVSAVQNDTSAGRGAAERQPRIPPRLSLYAALRLTSTDVSLITYDPDLRTLVARGRGIVESR